jgi:muramidase (phage lysozyme)
MARRTTVTRTSDVAIEKQATPAGIYIASVVSHLDQKFNGSLKVQILKLTEGGNDYQQTGQLLTAHYASPFTGQTPLQNVGANDTYAESQQSYGFWAVPPDIGTKVIILKVEGADDFGYWVGCVQDEFMNFMIPDGRPASANNNQARKLPVGEYNKALVDPDGETQPTRFPKPVNQDFANILAEAGLLEDDIRGLTSSSARREVPSAVFGMSTPGPLDKRDGSPRSPRGPTGTEASVPSSRLGGSSIVMDDGDDKILRKGPPDTSPMEYTDIENGGSDGSVEHPANELFRIRTRTGHQILLHNTEDLIYIGNGKGTTWIEMTSNGKIDIYAEDSISVHTGQDLNFTADRDINFNATKNINMAAGEKIKTTAGSSMDFTSVDYTAFVAGGSYTAKADSYVSLFSGKTLSVEGSNNVSIVSNSANVSIAAAKKANIAATAGIHIGTAGDLHHKVGNYFRETNASHVNSQEYFNYSKGGMHFKSDADIYQTAKVTMNITGKLTYVTSNGGDLHIKSSADINLHSTSNINEYSQNILRNASATIQDRAGSAIKIQSTGGTIDVNSSTTTKILAGSTLDVKSGTTTKITSGTAMDLKTLSGNLTTEAAVDLQLEGAFVKIDAGATAAAAVEAGTASIAKSAIPAIAAAAATTAIKPNPVTPQIPIISLIAKIPSRVPQHEPWLQHENLNPVEYTPEKTRAGIESVDSFAQLIPDTFVNIGSRDTSGTVQTADRGGTSGSQNYTPPTDGEYGEEELGDFNELKRDQIYVVGDGHAEKIAQSGGYKGSPRLGATVEQIAANQVGRIPEDTIVIVAAGANNWQNTPVEVASKIQEDIIDPLLLKNCYVIVVTYPPIDLAGPYAATYSSAGYTVNYNAVRYAVATVSANGSISLSTADIDSSDPQKTFATSAAYQRVASAVDAAISSIPDPSPFDKFSGTFGPILAAIRISELSTAEPRGYDIVYGGIPDYQKPPRPITQMTVDDVLIWQESILPTTSTAAGAYQFIYSTLKDLVDNKRVVPRSARMDAATQDRLALALMLRKTEWQAGQLSDEDFGYGLARVWASLPVMKVGVKLSNDRTSTTVNNAYYGGVGPNPSTAREPASFIKEALVASKRGIVGENQSTDATISPEGLAALGFEAGDPYEDLAARSTYTDAGSNIGNLENVDRVRQRQGSAGFRYLPVQQQIIDVLNRAATAAGVYVHITSGGQMPLEEFMSKPSAIKSYGRSAPGKNPPWKDFYLLNASGDKVGVRTGSSRHDTGLAADVKLTRDSNPTSTAYINYNFGTPGRGADNEVWDNFIYHAFKFGCRGFGFASGYMGTRTIHLDLLGAIGGSGYNSNVVGHWLTASYFVNIAQQGLNDS